MRALCHALIAGVLVVLVGVAFVEPAAAAEGPGVGVPAVVSLGDSAISGEAGRWAGNTTSKPVSAIDTYGVTSYWDTPTGEAIPGCHRSASAEIAIGAGVRSRNLACSGSMTWTWNIDGSIAGQPWKPGLDRISRVVNGEVRSSQLLMLEDYARTHNVKMVVVQVGANDYGFNEVVARCLANFASSTAWWSPGLGYAGTKNLCSDDPDMVSRFTQSQQNQRVQQVADALYRVRESMARVGYRPDQWDMVVQTYWSPIPRGSGIRYSEGGWTRQSLGGCGLFDADADWLNDTVLTALNNTMRRARDLVTSGLRFPDDYLPPQLPLDPIYLLDMEGALVGHRLCEKGVGLLEEWGLNSWRDQGAVDRLEWVAQVRTGSALVQPFQPQEGGHANRFGQYAMRNCLRQAWNDGALRSGRCVPAAQGGVNGFYGEPNMTLAPL